MKTLFTACATLALSTSLVYAGGGIRCALNSLPQLTANAFGEEGPACDNAIATLRGLGPEGLQALLKAADAKGVSEEKACRAIDRVAAQRDARLSGLYWYTDMAKAKRAANQLDRPILSLRLLGELQNEYSCANSRFFRTALYSNPEVADYLRENFVLHWKTVRPIPVITIDFGDGRKIERTITGNSAHYILDKNGRAVDAIPGLYGPKAFLRLVGSGHRNAVALADTKESEFDRHIRMLHEAGLAKAMSEWSRDLKRVRGADGRAFDNMPIPGQVAAAPDARAAAVVAATKMVVEQPMLARIMPAAAGGTPVELANATTEDDWSAIAALYREDAKLAPQSIKLIRNENPDAVQAGRRAAGKWKVEDPLARMVRNFERSIAMDTVRNQYLLHTRIHQWFIEKPSQDPEALNKRVYAELFLTPDSDPWLGLVPADTYTALEEGGLTGTN